MALCMYCDVHVIGSSVCCVRCYDKNFLQCYACCYVQRGQLLVRRRYDAKTGKLLVCDVCHGKRGKLRDPEEVRREQDV